MDRGDLFKVCINGIEKLVCIIDQYTEPESGQEMLVLALIDNENVVRVPAFEIEPLFINSRQMN